MNLQYFNLLGETFDFFFHTMTVQQLAGVTVRTSVGRVDNDGAAVGVTVRTSVGVDNDGAAVRVTVGTSVGVVLDPRSVLTMTVQQ